MKTPCSQSLNPPPLSVENGESACGDGEKSGWANLIAAKKTPARAPHNVPIRFGQPGRQMRVFVVRPAAMNISL
jgi:hypothetical protein